MYVIKNISTILISILIFGSCQEKMEITELESVASVVLNDLYKPLGSPPPYPKTFKIDSITNDFTVKGTWSSKKDSVTYFRELKKINEKSILKDTIFMKIDINYFHKEINNTECVQHRVAFHKERVQSKKHIKIASLNNLENKNLIILPLSLKDQFNGYYPEVIFSNLYFNEKYNKSIIIGSISRGKLNSISIIFYLEKIDDQWEIICSEGLSIS